MWIELGVSLWVLELIGILGLMMHWQHALGTRLEALDQLVELLRLWAPRLVPHLLREPL